MNLRLINNNYLFDGYLVIKIDSNTRIYSDEFIFKTSIYWKKSINNLEDNTDIVYFWWIEPDLVSKYCDNFEKGERDELTIFFKYYSTFNYNSQSNCKSFLFNFSGDSVLNSNNLLINEYIYTQKNDKKVHYIFAKCKFNTAIVEIENSIIINNEYISKKFIKVFIPTSSLKEFNLVNDLCFNNLFKGGFIIKRKE